MAIRRTNVNNRSESGSFIAIPHQLLDSDAFRSLSFKAARCLLDMCSQYYGTNNGDLSCTFKLMQQRGWKSKSTLESARNELLVKGFIVLTRQGGRNSPSLFALTWKPINECGGKHDSKPDIISKNYWKNGTNPEIQYVGNTMICYPK